MLLSNSKRLKIQGIIKRIAQDKSITLEERIYVENLHTTIRQFLFGWRRLIALGEMV